MNQYEKKLINKMLDTPLATLFSSIYNVVILGQINYLKLKWSVLGMKKPNQEEMKLVRENVTFIYKSFERQKLAIRLYKNIQSYYPGVKVIIADDSSKPLKLEDDFVEVIHLPFNIGLSAGLNRALEKVTTPFVVRMDDDELLTPYTRFHEQLRLLLSNESIDLVGVLVNTLPKCIDLQKVALQYFKQPMDYAPKKLKIPHMTPIDDTHLVVGKTPNCFIARTDKVREVGYDDNIRMIDHNEFFYRAAGNLVSVLDLTCFVLHYHNCFDRHYQRYRSDFKGDIEYIKRKWEK